MLNRLLSPTGFTVRALEANRDVIYVLDRHERIIYCNAAWDAFASQNKARHLERDNLVGRDSLNGVPSFLRQFYLSVYNLVFCTQRPWQHDCQCSSPEKYRAFHMRVLPLSRSYLLIENSLLVERSHRRKYHTRRDAQYINRYGWIIMCSHCRRSEHFNRDGKREWHWIPSYLGATPAPVSHGICPACVSYYLKLTLTCSE